MLQPKSIKSKKVKSPSSIEVSLEIRERGKLAIKSLPLEMLSRAAEEVGPKECLIFWRAFFDSFFGSLSRRNEMDDGRQRKNDNLNKIITYLTSWP